jgi:hypothetical protein
MHNEEGFLSEVLIKKLQRPAAGGFSESPGDEEGREKASGSAPSHPPPSVEHSVEHQDEQRIDFVDNVAHFHGT